MATVVTDRGVAILCLCSFSIGILFGYKLKSARIRYLKWKKDRLIKKLNDTTTRIKLEAAG